MPVPPGVTGEYPLAVPPRFGLGDVNGPAQVVPWWHVQQGIVAIPTSCQPERMASNLDVFDFGRSDGDLAEIATLDGGPFAGVDSDVSGH